MDQRVQFIADYQRDMFDVADLARRYGISRKTAYKWIDRYEAAGPAGLVDRSRRPVHAPNATPAAIVAALVELSPRTSGPRWTAQNRPSIDTSKPATTSGRSRQRGFTAWRPLDASRCGLWYASSAVRT